MATLTCWRVQGCLFLPLYSCVGQVTLQPPTTPLTRVQGVPHGTDIELFHSIAVPADSPSLDQMHLKHPGRILAPLFLKLLTDGFVSVPILHTDNTSRLAGFPVAARKALGHNLQC